MSLARAQTPELPTSVVAVQAQGTSTYRNGDRDRFERPRERVRQRRHHADCHRDVRTHRINGEMVPHRHVGDRCTVLTVNRSGQTIPRE